TRLRSGPWTGKPCRNHAPQVAGICESSPNRVVRYLPRRSAGAGRSIHSTFAWLVREASWLFGSASVRLFGLTVRIAIAGGSRRPHGASIARGDPAVDTRNQ